MSMHVTYASGDPQILEKAFQLLQCIGLWMPSIDSGSDSTTSWDCFFLKIQKVGLVLNTTTYFNHGVREDTPDS